MAKSNPAEVIDAYRRRQERRSTFTFADISTALLFLIILASSIYVAITGGPKLPILVDLKTNTPTFTPSITPTPSATATITSTPTETPDLDKQCTCASPEILVVTATFGLTNSLLPLPTATEAAAIAFTSSPTLIPTETPTSTNTPLPTPTPLVYTVQRGDTLGGIALKFGVTVEAIQSLNNLSSTMIYVGEVLQIPGP
jgi:nucleoid-associated protein YgaU